MPTLLCKLQCRKKILLQKSAIKHGFRCTDVPNICGVQRFIFKSTIYFYMNCAEMMKQLHCGCSLVLHHICPSKTDRCGLEKARRPINRHILNIHYRGGVCKWLSGPTLKVNYLFQSLGLLINTYSSLRRTRIAWRVWTHLGVLCI